MTPLPKMLSRFAELVRVVYRRFQEDHGLQVASSLTFTTLLSLVSRLRRSGSAPS